MELIVVNSRYHTGDPKESAYVGRGSIWGNEWSHLPHGKAIHLNLASVQDAIFNFTDFLINGKNTRLMEELWSWGTEAFGRKRYLVCYCVDENGNGPCHAKVLATIAKECEEADHIDQVTANWQAKLDAKRHLYTPRCVDCEHHVWEWPNAEPMEISRNCMRCGGSGYFEAFGHIYGGRCFRCGGSGTDPDYTI